jgi:hypothetical protein
LGNRQVRLDNPMLGARLTALCAQAEAACGAVHSTQRSEVAAHVSGADHATHVVV